MRERPSPPTAPRRPWLAVGLLAAGALLAWGALELVRPAGGAQPVGRAEDARPSEPDDAPLSGVLVDPRRVVAQPPAPAATPAAAPAVPPVALEDAPACCIVGRVVDARGEPVPGATVEARASEALPREHLPFGAPTRAPRTTHTAQDGSFSLEVPAGVGYGLVATHAEHAAAALPLAFAGSTHTLVLGEGAALSVLARGPSGPLASAELALRVTVPESATVLWEAHATSGPEGLASFARVPAGTLHASARRAGLAPAELELECDGKTPLDVELVLAPGVELVGIVVARADGTPLSGARVGGPALGWCETDREGHFRLADLAPGAGERAVEASAPGFAVEWQYVALDTARRLRELRFELGPALAVRGSVRDEAGLPVPEARVRLAGGVSTHAFVGETHHDATVTDWEGRFTFTSVRPGVRYRLSAERAPAGRGMLEVGPFDMGEAGPVELAPIVLGRAGSIAGVVEGVAPWEAQVRLSRAGEDDRDPASLGTVALDPQGRFRFEGLGAGRYLLEARARSASDAAFALHTVELAHGEAKDGVRLGLGRGIEGAVVDPAGVPLFMIEVRSSSAEPGRAVTTTTTDMSGRFHLAADGGGPWRLELRDPTQRHEGSVLEDVTAQGEPLAITLWPLVTEHSIVGTLLSEDGAPVQRVYVGFVETDTGTRISRVAIPDPQGRFEMKNLRDIEYDLDLVDFDKRCEPLVLPRVRPSAVDVHLRVRRR